MPRNSELKVRVMTAAIYVGAMVILIIPGLWVPLIPVFLFTAVAFLSAYEKGQAVRLRLPETKVLAVAVISVLLGLSALLGIVRGSLLGGLPASLEASMRTLVAARIFGYFALLALFILPMLSLVPMWRKGSESLTAAVAMSALVLSSAVPLASVIALLYGCYLGWHWLVLALLTSWVSDTCAYFAGKYLGRMPFSPALSPKKTWEGTVGGIVGTILLYLVYFPLVIGKASGYASGTSLAFAPVAAVFMSLTATLGDLQSSALKRWSGIKDFGALLPGHGGISDRFDSIFTALPAALLLAIFAGAVL